MKLIAFVAGILSIAAFASARPSRQVTCSAYLDAQSAVEACENWTACTQWAGSCCSLRLGALNWKACRKGPVSGDKQCSNPTKKYYPFRIDTCGHEQCIEGTWATSTTIYENDYTLLACEN
jgi:hypothetical protein